MNSCNATSCGASSGTLQIASSLPAYLGRCGRHNNALWSRYIIDFARHGPACASTSIDCIFITYQSHSKSTCAFRLMTGMKWTMQALASVFDAWATQFKLHVRWTSWCAAATSVTGNVLVKNCWSAEQQASIRKTIVVCLRNKIQGIRLVLSWFVSPCNPERRHVIR